MDMVVENQLDTEIRGKTLDAVKRHKASWLQLGQHLYSIHKQKLFRHWGFQTFEGYCMKELKLKQTTAGKLLKSYYFLEREEPRIARAVDENSQEFKDTAVPDFESVNLLRLAKDNKNMTPHDIAEVRESVIDKAREPKEVKAQVKRILEEKDPKSAEEEARLKKNAAIKRTLTFLKSIKVQFERERTVPKYLIKQINDLTEKLEDQLE